MAQSLEKAFLQKVAQMPQEELELAPPPPRIKQSKPGRKGKGTVLGGRGGNAKTDRQFFSFNSVFSSVCALCSLPLLSFSLLQCLEE